MLVCARLRHVAGTQWGSKKYMNMKHLEAVMDYASTTSSYLSHSTSGEYSIAKRGLISGPCSKLEDLSKMFLLRSSGSVNKLRI